MQEVNKERARSAQGLGARARCALRAWLIGGLALGALGAQADIKGAGATFPSQVYLRWASSYEKQGGTGVSYKPTGSGDGVKQISAHTVQFGGSDTPLTPKELSERHLVQIPMLVGGIVPVVNLPGIGDKRLQLSGELLGDIMAGEVKQWNDPRIAALNPGVALPAWTIRRIVRAEKSGTTEGLSRYLSGTSPRFASAVGIGQLPKWPGEVERAEGNDGMVHALKALPGAIAYVSYDRAQQDHLAGVKLRNAAGNWVAASEPAFRSAILQSDLSRMGDDQASLTDRPGPDSWPITMTSFILLDATPASADAAGTTMRFIYWCFMHGDELTRGTGFAPIPTTLQARLAARFQQVRAQDQKQPDYLSF
jgi:phosphate transport system substrate-binding protein